MAGAFNKGNKYGRQFVRSVPDPLSGKIIAGQVNANGDNQWKAFASTATYIEGVAVKALAANTGTIYVTGAGGSSSGFPLAKGETVSIAIDDLAKVQVFIASNGDGAAYLAIEAARD